MHGRLLSSNEPRAMATWALSMYSLMGRGLQIGVIFRSHQEKACYDDLAFTCGTLRGAGDRLDRARCS